jgi:hypothetical protein
MCSVAAEWVPRDLAVIGPRATSQPKQEPVELLLPGLPVPSNLPVTRLAQPPGRPDRHVAMCPVDWSR